MDLKAIFFDFDGVLVDTEWAIYSAWRDTFARYGEDLPLSLYTRCIGSDFETWSPKTYLEGLTGEVFDWERLDAERQVVIREELLGEGPMPGVVELLEEVAGGDVAMAVVSSSSHAWVDGWLDRLGLGGYFEEVVCRGDAPRIKPAPDLYSEAGSRFRVEGRSCLVIEDSLNGMRAAKAAGMPVWIVPNRVTGGLDFSEADGVFGDFCELGGVLAGEVGAEGRAGDGCRHYGARKP